MEPEQILKEFEKSLCERYDVYPVDGCTGTAPTGEPYVTYTCQGPKEEGEAGSKYGKTAIEAVENYMHQIAIKFLPPYTYRNDKAVIFWRTRPEIQKDPEGERYDIWSRFLISDKRYFKGA